MQVPYIIDFPSYYLFQGILMSQLICPGFTFLDQPLANLPMNRCYTKQESNSFHIYYCLNGCCILS